MESIAQSSKTTSPRRLVTVEQFAAANAAFSHGALRSMINRREQNGFAPAFVWVNRRVLIDVDAFFRVIEEQNARRQAPEGDTGGPEPKRAA